MRLGYALLLASTAGLLTLAAPTLARNSEPQKASEQPSSSPCHAYQQAADGSWTQVSCQEMGPTGQTQHTPAPHGTDEETH
ncbi:MAG: hypothetical protein ABI561_05065 [Bradyrhizobium sp.]